MGMWPSSTVRDVLPSWLLRWPRALAGKILVTGATGNVGSELVRELLRAGRPVRALVRGRVPAAAAGAEIAAGGLDRPESLRAALRGVRGVFLPGGPRGHA